MGDMKVQSQLCLVMTTTAHQHIQNDVHFLNQVFFWSEPGGGGRGGRGGGQGSRGHMKFAPLPLSLENPEI